MDPKQRAEMDQSLALMIDYYPTQWRQLYQRMLDEGFTKAEALEILKTYIDTSCRATQS